MRPRLLDLFCGAGGASMGYWRAGFAPIGVDIKPQPNYPFPFLQADALDRASWPLWMFDRTPDVIHASPPCQRYSDLAKRNRNAHEWPDLIADTRQMISGMSNVWVIENVEGAPLYNPMTLCGTMFPELRVIRHRLFESNVSLGGYQFCLRRTWALPHGRHPLVFTHDKRKAHYGKLDQDTSFVQVTGGGNATVANKGAAMGIDWMTGAELNEAIPPAYTEYIGRQLLAALTTACPRCGGAGRYYVFDDPEGEQAQCPDCHTEAA
jgi:DNA (cytosine-5)-methyltransferase 1